MKACPKKTGVATRSAGGISASPFETTREAMRKTGIRHENVRRACKNTQIVHLWSGSAVKSWAILIQRSAKGP